MNNKYPVLSDNELMEIYESVKQVLIEINNVQAIRKLNENRKRDEVTVLPNGGSASSQFLSKPASKEELKPDANDPTFKTLLIIREYLNLMNKKMEN